MKQAIKYILKKKGIKFLIAVKDMYLRHSDGAFSLYDSIKMSIEYKRTNDDILYRLQWELSTLKDYSQY